MRDKRFIFGGKGHYSICVHTDVKDEDAKAKQNYISNYRALFISSEERILASEVTEDKFVVDYVDDHVVGVFRQITQDEEKVMVPFKGLFCALWFEGKKARKVRFLWSDMSEMSQDNYKYVGLVCLGIEQKIVLKLCDILFSQLISAVNGPLSEQFKGLATEQYIDRQLMLEE